MVDDVLGLPEGDSYAFTSLEAVNGERLRTLIGSTTMNGTTYVIRVARSEERLYGELRELAVGLVVAFPLAIGLSGLAGARMARRALEPIDRMAVHAKDVTAERLHDRLPIDNPNDELGRLATIFNDTLGRLEESFDRLRRFTADASHELRTPLTAMRSVGEVGLSAPRDASSYRDIIGSMLEEVERLTRLVDSLLTLSRADARQIPIQCEPVDLAELGRELVTDLNVLAEEKHQTLNVRSTGPVFVSADRLVLTQAIVNLLHNAIKYSPEGADIVVAMGAEPEPHLDVTDRGPGIPGEHRDRIFDRFYRADRSRSRRGGGAGLGLAIARWAVEANRGRLTLHATGPHGSTFRIQLPRV